MRRWWLWALMILVLLAGGYALWQHQHISQSAGSLYVERDKVDLPPIDPASQPALRSVAPPSGAASTSTTSTSTPPVASAAQGLSSAATPAAQAASTQATSQTTSAQATSVQTSSGATAPATPVSAAGVSASTTVPEADGRVRILLIGTDQNKLGNTPAARGRSDVLLVLMLDPKAKTLTLLSIPRDLRLDIPEDGVHKVNAAYNYGGASLTARTLEIYLGVPFDYYVEVSFEGFSRLISAVGGVNVQVPFSFSSDDVDFVKGLEQLNGPAALAYVRMRKEDPAGDLGREARQQQVIQLLLAKLAGLAPDKLSPLLNSLQGNLRTDLTPSEVVSLKQNHAYALDPAHQRRLQVQGHSQQIDGIWYYVISDDERRKLYLSLR